MIDDGDRGLVCPRDFDRHFEAIVRATIDHQNKLHAVWNILFRYFVDQANDGIRSIVNGNDNAQCGNVIHALLRWRGSIPQKETERRPASVRARAKGPLKTNSPTKRGIF